MSRIRPFQRKPRRALTRSIAVTRLGSALAVFITAGTASAQSVSSPAPTPPPLPNPAVPSAPDAIKAMTLAQAMAYAELHQPSLRLARARIGSAKALTDVPRGQWLPKVGALAEIMGGTSNNTTSSYVSSSVLDIPRIGGTSAVTADKLTPAALKPYASSFVGIGIDQEVFDFGRIATQTAALDALVDVERFREDSDRLDVELAVKEAYFAVLSSKGILTAADSALERAKAQKDLTQAGMSNGLRTAVDLARADAELAKYDVGRIRAQGSLDLARGLLAMVIAYPGAAVDASSDAAFSDASPPSLERAIAEAERQDPVLREAEARVRAQEAQTKAISAEKRPNLYFTSTLSGRAGGAPLANGDTSFGRGVLPDIPNYDAGFVLTVPIFDGVIQARKNASRAQESVFRSQLEVEKQKGTEEVESAYFSLRASEAAVPALQRARDAARNAFDQTEAAFKLGLGTSVDVAESETLLTNAEIQLALGRFELSRARALLSRAMAEPEDTRGRARP